MLSVREIKETLRRERLAISKRRGQNFLVDSRAQKRIIDAVDVRPSDEILEIGSGLGALTEDLAKSAAKVIAVEKDAGLARVLRKSLSGYNNLDIICKDILQTNIGRFTHQKLKVVGNLPYYITTPIVGYLLEGQRERIKEIFITVQNEVGRRLAAKPGNKDYSAITLLVRYFTEAKLLFPLPKRAFYPQPKVDSVFVHLRILKEPGAKVNSEKQFFRIIRKCFNQRRKTILNSLTHKLEKQEKTKIQQALSREGINIGARPETLSISDFSRIENVLHKRRIKV